VTGSPGRAGLVTRLIAAVVDAVAIALLVLAIFAGTTAVRFVLSPLTFSWPQPSTLLSASVVAAAAVLYLAAAWATTGRTYGAGLLGLRVLTAAGTHLGWGRAVLRAALCVVFPVGLLWTAVSPTRRSVQDALLRTVVVYDWHLDGGVRAARQLPAEPTTGDRLPAAAPDRQQERLEPLHPEQEGPDGDREQHHQALPHAEPSPPASGRPAGRLGEPGLSPPRRRRPGPARSPVHRGRRPRRPPASGRSAPDR
jgi:uncharacterized RDD family membrane protein YckC